MLLEHIYGLQYLLICMTIPLLPVAQMVKKICLQGSRPRFNPWVRKIPWRREWLLIPVFLPGDSRGQRSLAGYRPWGRRVRYSWATNIFTFYCLLQGLLHSLLQCILFYSITVSKELKVNYIATIYKDNVTGKQAKRTGKRSGEKWGKCNWT